MRYEYALNSTRFACVRGERQKTKYQNAECLAQKVYKLPDTYDTGTLMLAPLAHTSGRYMILCWLLFLPRWVARRTRLYWRKAEPSNVIWLRESRLTLLQQERRHQNRKHRKHSR